MTRSRLPEQVERVALLGWRLYPCASRGRAALVCAERDGSPPADLATHELDRLEAWADRWPGCGWRVVMEGSGIWALDCDAAGPDHSADGIVALAGLVRRYGPLPPRPAIRTGGGGLALFFRHTGEQIVGATGTPERGIDPRRGRQSVTIPPSLHHRTGAAYRWVTPPWELSPPQAPQWLLDLVKPSPPPARAAVPVNRHEDQARRYAVGALRRAVERVAAAGEGRRNDSLNRECYSIGRFIREGALGAQEVADSLALAARHAGLSASEIAATIESALRARVRA